MLVIELASTTFTGSESSQSVNAVVTKSKELSVAIVTVRLTFNKHSSMSATGKCTYYPPIPHTVSLLTFYHAIVTTKCCMCAYVYLCTKNLQCFV